MNNTIEFDQNQIDRIDDVHNAVHDVICTLLNKSSDEVPYDIRKILTCTDVLIETLVGFDDVESVYYPTRFVETDGTTYITDNIDASVYKDPEVAAKGGMIS